MPTSLPTKLRLKLSILAASLCSLAFAAPAAQAGQLVDSAASCEGQVMEQPFLPWLDPANYVLAPDGTLEGGAAGWSLSGGASVAGGNEPYYVHAAGESHQLSLPAGSSATTQAMCVGVEHPTLRLFVRKSSGLLATLKVEVLYEDLAGNVQSLTLGNVLGGSSYQPTLPMAIGVNALGVLSADGHTAVAFRFTPNSGNWAIDDVYVDPYHR